MNTKTLILAALTAIALSAQNQSQLPFPDLVGPLKATPGCLGVETARTASGKMVIFAWFRWTKIDHRAGTTVRLHQQLVKMAGGRLDPESCSAGRHHGRQRSHSGDCLRSHSSESGTEGRPVAGFADRNRAVSTLAWRRIRGRDASPQIVS